MGKWGKYNKQYKQEWEKDPKLKAWLEPSSENDVMNGKPEAYCRLCKVHLRAHHADLILHSSRQKHVAKEQSFNRSVQPNLQQFGHHIVSHKDKILDLKLTMYIAMHSSIKTVDHLSELLKQLGKGTPLEKLRLHRTKCSKLISAVISPAFLTQLVKDIGSQPYSLIVDEATDNSSSKFMGICVTYYSQTRQEMVTDFLGLVQVTSCTGEILAQAVKEYLAVIGLPVAQLHAIGTDGAPNMCGRTNSFYTHLREAVPHLQIFKCVCHSIDKCAEYAHMSIPDNVNYLLRESHNWFSHSALRWGEYEDYFKTINNGKMPLKIPQMGETRWLSWAPVCDVIFGNWTELGGFFALVAATDSRTQQRQRPRPASESQRPKDKTVAQKLADLFKDKSIYMYIVFLRGVLRDISKVNMAFQHTRADMAKLHTDLRALLFGMASRILKPEAIPQTDREGVLRSVEVDALRASLQNKDHLLPLDRANFGEGFKNIVVASPLAPQELAVVRNNCGKYIFTLCMQLIDRLPGNIQAVERLRFLSPRFALARSARPSFDKLPTDFAEPGADLDLLGSQWTNLAHLTVLDICPHPDMNQDVNNMDAIHFWSCVLNYSNAVNERPFKELALFCLRCLTVPVSNAVIERVFSFLAAIKTKYRNRLQLTMIEALLRVRVHMTMTKECCRTFEPDQDMLERFNSSMYDMPRHGGASEPSALPAPAASADEQAVDDPGLPENDDLDEIEQVQLNLISSDGDTHCTVFNLM